MTIAIYTHSDCLGHDPGEAHPENSGRISAILHTLEHVSFKNQLSFVAEDLDNSFMAEDEHILLAHSPEHLETIKTTAPESGRQALDADTVMSSGSLSAAYRGVGAACHAVDDIIGNKYSSAFCVTRPPGHHSTSELAMGFCIFNNAAIAALYAQKQYQLKRVAIVDFDVHHGNGTQDIMSGREGILYISTHQSPLYPGSGSEAENIPGNILNIPLISGTSDPSYQRIFAELALPALREFKPELIIVSAGFDAHRDDPLASLALTEKTYHWLGQQLSSEGKLVSILEGGYNQNVLGSSASSFLEGTIN